MTPEQFAQKIKTKYPEYKDVNDLELAKSVIMKYPQYQQNVNFAQAKKAPQSGLRATLSDAPSDISEAFSNAKTAIQTGMQTAGDIQTRVQNLETTPAAGTFQTVGAGLKAGAHVIGEGFLGLLKSLASPATEQKVAGAVSKGVTAVADTDTFQNLALKYSALSDEQKRNVDAAFGVLEGVGTVAGAGSAFNAARSGLKPVANVAGRAAAATGQATGAAARLPAMGVSEIQGALTGTSGETIRQAFNAARNGGKELDQFTDALRNKTTPEQLVNRLREGTEKINAEKTARFGQMLDTIGDEVVPTASIRQEVASDLKKIGVAISDDGTLDFSSSKFRTVPKAQTKLEAMWREVSALGDNQTIRGIDTSRQALKALLLEGDDASANTANLAINNAVSRVRGAGKTVEGYGKALDDFGDDAEFLNEITRSLSSGDQATIDTTYRKLATTLKTNNERRRNLLMELDEATGGYVLSSVAGQQLSEELPRGLFRQIAAGMAGLSVATGGISAGVLPALVFASPRVTGEVLRALGIATGKVDALLNAFSKVRSEIKIPTVDIDTPIKNYVDRSQPGLSIKNISPENVAKKLDAKDATLLNKYSAQHEELTTYMEVSPLLEQIGIDNFPLSDQLRFIKETLDLWNSRK